MNKPIDKEIRLNLLKLLKEDPTLTQREMNKKMDVSLGKINYCISTLVNKGIIKVERFKKSKNKMAYMYRLTPKGFEELSRLTISFLKFRIAEYDKIKAEIKLLSDQIAEINQDLINDPELLKDLEKIN